MSPSPAMKRLLELSAHLRGCGLLTLADDFDAAIGDAERYEAHLQRQLHTTRRKNANQRRELKELVRLLERSVAMDIRDAVRQALQNLRK